MKANQTDIRAADNQNGYYCGSCHNGGIVFSSCKNDYTQKDVKTCDRCHSVGKKVAPKYNFREFVKGLPRERLGNGVDWEKAEPFFDRMQPTVDRVMERVSVALPEADLDFLYGGEGETDHGEESESKHGE